MRRSNGLQVVADPIREPRLIAQTMRSGYLHPRELAGVTRWTARVIADPKTVLAQRDSTLAASFDEAGVTGRLRHEVLDPFLAGVLVDSHGGSSANFTKLLVRMFALGRPAVPATGMQALPEQVARPLGDRVRLQSHVETITPVHGGVDVCVDGQRLRARSAVVATDPVGAANLTTLPEPATKGLVTWWFEAPEPPHTLPVRRRRRPSPRLGPARSGLEHRRPDRRRPELRPADEASRRGDVPARPAGRRRPRGGRPAPRRRDLRLRHVRLARRHPPPGRRGPAGDDPTARGPRAGRARGRRLRLRRPSRHRLDPGRPRLGSTGGRGGRRAPLTRHARPGERNFAAGASLTGTSSEEGADGIRRRRSPSERTDP